MKKILQNLGIGLALFLGVAYLAHAATAGIPITVPSATSSGYMLVSTTSGRYIATTTDPAHFGWVFATSTTNASRFPLLSLATTTAGCLSTSALVVYSTGTDCASITGGTASMLTSWLTSTTLTATSTPTASHYLATSSIASRFPYASTTAITSSGTSDFGGLIVTGTSDFQGALSDSNSFLTINDDLAVLGTATSTMAGSLAITGGLSVGGAIEATLTISDYSPVLAPYFTATSTTQASTFPYASTTALSVSGGFTVTPLTSALTLTGADGTFAEYTGTTCTSQFVTVLSALGAATCASINNDYWSGIDLSVANGGTGLSTFGGTNTVLYTTAADTLASEAAFTYNSTADRLTATYASTTMLTTSAGATFATASGNVGIGTTSPTSLLSVHGSGLFAGDLSVAGLTATGTVAFTGTTATTTISGGLSAGNNAALVVNQAATANSLYITSTGNVGIGTTSPSKTLAVQGGAIVSGTITASNFRNSSSTSLGGVSLDNVATSTIRLFNNYHKAVTVERVDYGIFCSSGNCTNYGVVFNIRHALDMGTASTSAATLTTNTFKGTSTTTAQSLTSGFSDVTLAAEEMVWIEITGASTTAGVWAKLYGNYDN